MMNNKINTILATDARKDWSRLIDTVVHDRPHIIRRTRDYVFMTDLHMIEDILLAYNFTAERYIEEDGSVTLSLNELDLVANGLTESDTKRILAADILDYAEEYYDDFKYWSSTANRKKHIPYILKALILDDIDKIGEVIQCQAGKN